TTPVRQPAFPQLDTLPMAGGGHASLSSATAADQGVITSEMPRLRPSAVRRTRLGQAKRLGNAVCSRTVAPGTLDTRPLAGGESGGSIPKGSPPLTSIRG